MNLFKKILISLLSLTMCFAIVGMNDVKAADYTSSLLEVGEGKFGKTYGEYVGGNDKEDIYRFHLDKTRTIQINVAHLGKVNASLLNSSQKTVSLTWQYLGDNEYAAVKTLSAGDYYLKFDTSSEEDELYYFTLVLYNNISQKISGPKSSYTLTYNYSGYLNPVAYSGKIKTGAKLTYSTSNKKVVTVTSSGKIKAVGYGSATITIKSGYVYDKPNFDAYVPATKKVSITVVPKAVKKGTIYNYKVVKKRKKSVKQTLKKQLRVTWSRDKTVTGYQIQIAKNKKFTSGRKSSTISKNSTTSKTFTKLKKGSKYYMRIRSYKKVGKKYYYSSWSTTSKTIKVY